MTAEPDLPKLNFSASPLLIAAALMALAAPSSPGQAAAPSTPPSSNAPYVPTMTFDVASVHLSKDLDLNAGITIGGGFTQNTTKLHVINFDIGNLISLAYGVDQFQIEGWPKWPRMTMFVIDAKGDPEADAKMATLSKSQQQAEQQHMVQALLEERFNLKTHWETKEGDVYNLIVAKGGPKLGAEGSTTPSAEELKDFGIHPIPPIYQKNDGQGYDFIAHSCPMNELVDTLTGQFGRPVIDKTGLTGKYDFVLKYKDRWDRDRDADDPDPTPPMDRALQTELGLKVEPAKGPIKILVIDHIEKLSEN